MYVCMYVCICVYMYVCMQTRMYVCMYVCMHTPTNIFTIKCMNGIHMFLYMYEYQYVCTPIFVNCYNVILHTIHAMHTCTYAPHLYKERRLPFPANSHNVYIHMH